MRMIHAKGKDDHGKPLLLFGLSGADLRQLRGGFTIKTDLDEVGLEGMAVLFYDTTDREPPALLSEYPPSHDDDRG